MEREELARRITEDLVTRRDLLAMKSDLEEVRRHLTRVLVVTALVMAAVMVVVHLIV